MRLLPSHEVTAQGSRLRSQHIPADVAFRGSSTNELQRHRYEPAPDSNVTLPNPIDEARIAVACRCGRKVVMVRRVELGIYGPDHDCERGT